MKTKGRRQSKNIIDIRDGIDPYVDTARKMAKNAQDYDRHQKMERLHERLKAGAKNRKLGPSMTVEEIEESLRQHREKKKKK